jgi:hypothetical protein
MSAPMIAQTDNSPASDSLPGAGRLAPPDFDLLMRLAIFMLIAWAFSLYGNEATGNHDEKIQDGVFWVLAGLAVVWRLRIKRGQAQASDAALAPKSTGMGQGEQLSQAARGQLTRDAKAAAAWLDAWRVVWWLAALAVLVYATQLFMLLVLLYAAWHALCGAMNLRRRRIWQRASKRAAASSGQGHAARTTAWFRPIYWFERFILSWLLLPARLGMLALSLLWRYGGQAIGDAVLVAVLWCLALLATAGAGMLAG